MNGSCRLHHALELLAIAGNRLAVFAFLGSEKVGDFRLVSFELNGRRLVSAEIPGALTVATTRLLEAAQLALDLNRPGWRHRSGSIGQVVFLAGQGFRIAGIDLDEKREAFTFVVPPGDLVPRGDGPQYLVNLSPVARAESEPVRFG